MRQNIFGWRCSSFPKYCDNTRLLHPWKIMMSKKWNLESKENNPVNTAPPPHTRLTYGGWSSIFRFCTGSQRLRHMCCYDFRHRYFGSDSCWLFESCFSGRFCLGCQPSKRNGRAKTTFTFNQKKCEPRQENVLTKHSYGVGTKKKKGERQIYLKKKSNWTDKYRKPDESVNRCSVITVEDSRTVQMCL